MDGRDIFRGFVAAQNIVVHDASYLETHCTVLRYRAVSTLLGTPDPIIYRTL